MARIVNLKPWLTITGTELPLADILKTIKDGCDGAAAKDGTGFNRNDIINDAHGLVDYLQGNPEQLKLKNFFWALKMVVFYQRQWKPYFPSNTLELVKETQKRLKEHFPYNPQPVNQ